MHLFIHCRPNIARAVSKILPAEQSRAFIGRMMGDPIFPFKIVVEQLITAGTAIAWEVCYLNFSLASLLFVGFCLKHTIKHMD